jgi:hypothetical protein
VDAAEPQTKVLGPPLCRIYERSAIGSLPANAPASPSLGVFALFSAGGCAGSAGRRRSSTILRRRRSPCRMCSHAASAPASERRHAMYLRTPLDKIQSKEALEPSGAAGRRFISNPRHETATR